MKSVKTGLIGCGKISPAYLTNLTTAFSPIVEVTTCSDLLPELAQMRAAEFHLPRACTTEELLSDPEIELVINLTFAQQHYDVSRAVLEAGKHLFSEKPLAVEREEGQALVDLARTNGLRIGGASDTFLGAGLQACRKLLDQGDIGIPLLASVLIALNYGAQERWNSRGTGPVFDMGPYYLTALVALLGPVREVTGMTCIPIPQKIHPTGSPLEGQAFTVSTPMEAAALLRFASGVVGVFAASGEASEGYVHRLEIYGTDGTLQASDPNMYMHSAAIRGGGGKEIKPGRGYTGEGRGLGVAEMAWALRRGCAPRASGDIMLHVLDIMHAIHEASDQHRHIELRTTCPRPEPFALDEMFAEFTTRKE